MKINKDFTKNDLQPGMLVITRDNSIGLVLETMRGLEIAFYDTSIEMYRFLDDLMYYIQYVDTENYGWDIMAVFSIPDSCINQRTLFGTVGRTLLWRRKEDKNESKNLE